VGQGDKTSLTNTTDTNILEYISGNLPERITGKVRTFLVKFKTHRGEPLNEGTDDLPGGRTDTGKGRGKLQVERTYNVFDILSL
jgi:hypothetical protein